MKVFRANSANALYVKACKALTENYDYETKSKGEKILEIHNALFELSSPCNNIITLKSRQLSKKYLAGETAFYLAGSDSLDFISKYAKFWKGISDDGKTVNSCYGKRLFKEIINDFSQIDYVVKQLTDKPDTKKAVALIYKERDTTPYTKDNPCTMYLHFAIRKNHLLLTSMMRSNDIWLGFPYDIFFFTTLQQIVLAKVNSFGFSYELGKYTHIANSLHCYERNMQGILLCSREKEYDLGSSPKITEKDIYAIDEYLEYERLLRTGKSCFNIDFNKLKESNFFMLLSNYLKESKK